MSKEIIFLSIPRAFEPPYEEPQVNMLEALRHFHENEKIILFSKDNRVQEAAKLYRCHVPPPETVDEPKPLIFRAFEYCATHYPNTIIVFLNSDIIIGQNLSYLVKEIVEKHKERWLLSAARHNTSEKMSLSNLTRKQKSDAIQNLTFNSEQHRASGMDIFIFDTSILEETQFPPFQIGELGWDSFFAAKARVLGIPFIDATAKLRIYHQNHDSHYQTDMRAFLSCIRKAGTLQMATLEDANFVITKNGIKVNLIGMLRGSKLGLSVLGALRIVKKCLSNG